MLSLKNMPVCQVAHVFVSLAKHIVHRNIRHRSETWLKPSPAQGSHPWMALKKWYKALAMAAMAWLETTRNWETQLANGANVWNGINMYHIVSHCITVSQRPFMIT